MARRANALIPLSWDHHHGLNLARTLRATLDGDDRFGSPSPDSMREMVASQWRLEIAGHFEDEEAVLGPLADDDERLAELLERMRREHEVIRSLVDEVAGSTGSDTAALARFADALTGHIRFEERQLFEAVEAHLDKAAQQQLGEALVDRRLDDGRSSEREVEVVRGGMLASSGGDEPRSS